MPKEQEQGVKFVSDTRDPFYVKQLEDAKAERVKVQKERDIYWNELSAIAREFHCYTAEEDILKNIRELKETISMIAHELGCESKRNDILLRIRSLKSDLRNSNSLSSGR